MKMIYKLGTLLALCLLSMTMVMALDYTPTGSQDFSVYIDPNAELSGRVFTTVSIDQSTYPGDAKCVNMLFFNESGTRYLHIQSNPKLATSSTIANLRVGAVTPEEKGYFDIQDGIGTMYFRDDDIIPYNEFLFVAICNVGNQTLIYEESVSPVWRVAFKSLPSRGAWFAESQNADMIVFVVAALAIILLVIYVNAIRK